MRIIIFGGGGFLGSRLALKLIESGRIGSQMIRELILFDLAFPEGFRDDQRFKCIQADFSDEKAIRDVLKTAPDLIFHLAAIVSGEAEKNLELGMEVNLHASLRLLEICRELNLQPKLVFASSCAVFGGDVSKIIVDDTAPKPRSSYGTQKAIVELLINDYSRRGYVDGRSLRLPTIAIRPGKANAATSSFVSSIIREPLNGQRASYPVPAETEVWIQSPKNVIANFIHAAHINKDILGDDRIITLPGLTTSIQTMIDSLGQISGQEVADLIDFIPDKFLQSIVLTWPPNFLTPRALELGFKHDMSTIEIIKSYIEEEEIKIEK